MNVMDNEGASRLEVLCACADSCAKDTEIERLRELERRAEYYINRLEAAHRGHVVRDLDEAHCAWDHYKRIGHQQSPSTEKP